MSPVRTAAGQKAAATRIRNAAKRGAAAEKAALTRRRRAAGKKAAATRKHRGLVLLLQPTGAKRYAAQWEKSIGSESTRSRPSFVDSCLSSFLEPGSRLSPCTRENEVL